MLIYPKAQIEEVDLRKARFTKDFTAEELAKPDGLFVKSANGTYSYYYVVITVGVRHSWDKLSLLLDLNDCIRPPDQDLSLVASYVKEEYTDFENIANSCKVIDY